MQSALAVTQFDTSPEPAARPRWQRASAPRDVLFMHADAEWCREAERALSTRGVRAVWRGVDPWAPRALETPVDAVLMDLDALCARRAIELVRALGTRPRAPAILAWGLRTTPADALVLGRHGVLALLGARPRPQDVWSILARASEEALAYEPHVRALIGHLPFEQILSHVRNLALDQALGITRGNRSRAAELLRVTRQTLQRHLRQQRAQREG